MRNRGHGTATLALLAGNELNGQATGWPQFTGPLGGAPYARIIPIRIADWVVRFSTSTMVEGFEHAQRSGAHVLSMSMGGLSSQALVDAINKAYDGGLFMVTAAGNNFANTLSPKGIVFPALYRRVLAACGVMANGSAYAGLHFRTMQGNYGPASKMATALGAYTPNVPWAVIGCPTVIGMDGAGTSSATPQVAAAAVLYLAKHWEALALYPEPWMKIEAVRHALFVSAAKSTPKMGVKETFEKLGQGVLNAAEALRIAPPAKNKLSRCAPSKASWYWLDLIFGGEVRFDKADPRQEMLKLELTQMAQKVAEMEQAIPDNGLPGEAIPAAARRRYLEAALDVGNPSKPLKKALENILGRPHAVSGGEPPLSPARVKRKVKELPSPRRRLRVFALDPSIAKTLDYVDVNETVLSIPWEEDLKPGPVGEYLEVVDVDPASNRLYDPVDLNEPKLLAQDGWPPSEGNPQFHQQMVYAVAMTVIGIFEKALGRKALWAQRQCPRRRKSGEVKPEFYEVPRLRIYPHALRTANAYYSPDKVALLFGYFKASNLDDINAPGSMIFTCLSSDIIAHEMSHALLDGLHRRFQEVSNPDVPAFHEAFADIVALFLHFSVPELVRFQVARARGRLDAAHLLGGLAKQFGEASRQKGPLRDYLGDDIRKLKYDDTLNVHDLGSILVSAVFDAFLKIVDRRTADLIRLATKGTGVLPQGALHPDLVNRITDEACKAASHVLRICIRALDYCPAVDITFGEFLRALITADIDLVPNDEYHYRVAFMEAFRKRNILPRDVRTFSEESLAWNTMENPSPGWLKECVEKLDLGWDLDSDRTSIMKLNEKNRWSMWNHLKKALANDPSLCAQFGLQLDLPRFDDEGKLLSKPREGKTTFDLYSVRPARRVAPDGSFRAEFVATILQRRPEHVDPDNPDAGWFWLRGGATLIIDPRKDKPEIRYAIIKNINSPNRLERHCQTACKAPFSSEQELYFGEMANEPFALLHASKGGSNNE